MSSSRRPSRWRGEDLHEISITSSVQKRMVKPNEIHTYLVRVRVRARVQVTAVGLVELELGHRSPPLRHRDVDRVVVERAKEGVLAEALLEGGEMALERLLDLDPVVVHLRLRADALEDVGEVISEREPLPRKVRDLGA